MVCNCLSMFSPLAQQLVSNTVEKTCCAQKHLCVCRLLWLADTSVCQSTAHVCRCHIDSLTCRVEKHSCSCDSLRGPLFCASAEHTKCLCHTHGLTICGFFNIQLSEHNCVCVVYDCWERCLANSGNHKCITRHPRELHHKSNRLYMLWSVLPDSLVLRCRMRDFFAQRLQFQ